MGNQKQQILSAYSHFFNTTLNERIQQSIDKDNVTSMLSLFHEVAATVPAYKMFLQEHSIDPEEIQTPAQFQALPAITKENYIQRYPLAERCRDGKLAASDMMAASSGSTGEPTLWPRSVIDELKMATRFEQIFLDSFEADGKSTLAIVCFSLGTCVGGMYTASCCRYLAQKGYPITVITPGNRKEEILRLVKRVGGAFEQVVLLGYPPFLKDVIDTGQSQGLNWPDYRVKMVTAGEVFSEEWRELVAERLGSERVCYDFASLYGTADAGVLGNETPLSIYIRRFLSAHPDVARALFGEARLPTLVQYDPACRFFEVDKGKLLFSGDNGVPLMRYSIKDTGGIVSYADMLSFLSRHGCDPSAEFKNSSGLRPLPFVYVFGRFDFTVSYFGANIYPENISVGLEQPQIRDWVTGKFVMRVGEDDGHNRFLSIVVELMPGETQSEARKNQLTESIVTQLLRLNSEFSSYVPKASQRPVVSLTPMGDPDYFPVGVKHRYTQR